MNPIFNELKIDRDIPIPIYYQVKLFMIEHIKTGNFKDGELVPPEEELCAQINISRPTLRQAFSELAYEGYINRVKAKGTFITLPKISGDFIQKIQNFSHEMESKGFKTKTSVLSFKEITAHSEIIKKLSLEEDGKVIYLERLRFADNKPIVLVQTYLDARKCDGILEEDFESNSLYEILEKKYGIRLKKLNRDIHASASDSYTSKHLAIEENSPLLYISTVAYDENDHPFEYSLASYRGDSYKMSVDLYRND